MGRAIIIFRYIILIFFLICFSSILVVRSEDLKGSVFTVRSGLSDNQITDIYQDSIGFLWIGTPNGLNKFDGYTFDHYQHQPLDTNSIPDNYIHCIAEGRRGELWIGTNRGLCRLDRRRDNFTAFGPWPVPGIPGMSRSEIYSVLVDTSGPVWFQTDDAIQCFHPGSKKITRYPHLLGSGPGQFEKINSKLVDDQYESLWFIAGERLYSFNKRTGLYARFEHKGKPARAILSNIRTGLWARSADELLLIDAETGQVKNYGKNIPGIKSLDIQCLFADDSDIIWIGADDKIMSFEPQNSSLKVFNGISSNGNFFSFSGVKTIMKDRSDIIWMGTDQGLFKIDRELKTFNHISQEFVSSVYEDDTGILWMGTMDSGLHKLNRSGGKKSIYTEENGIFSISDNSVYCVIKDSRGWIWAGNGNGVDIKKPDENRFIPFYTYETSEEFAKLKNLIVYSIKELPGGHILFATSRGAYNYNPYKHALSSYNMGTEVYCALTDSSGAIKFGTSEGLISYTPWNNQYEGPYPGCGSVHSLHLDSRQRLWVGTATGLLLFNDQKKQFEDFRTKKELSSHIVYGILEDQHGNLWFSSNRGLVMYQPDLEKILTFGPDNGIRDYEFIQGAASMNSKGEMFFGGVSGLTHFHPDSLRFNTHLPSLSFTKFELFGEKGKMSKPIDLISTVILPAGNQVVTFGFSALEFTDPFRNRYMYHMVKMGEDGLWIHLDDEHEVTFFKLHPGVYELSVKGSNSDQLWNQEEISIEIIVPSGLWQKLVSLLPYLLVVFVLIFLALMAATRRLRRVNRILKVKEYSALKIDRQRQELETKNKNITDSIIYAKRIQESLLPTTEIFLNLLPESFILYMPKDIVSGDFYWINKHGDKIFVAAVDCTGHGVPGAFVSIIGFELFRQITASERHGNPALILDKLNENFTEIFSDGDQVVLKDGMDLSLCVIDSKEKSLEFSGAFNPLYLVRDETIIEVKADRFSVGADTHILSQKRKFKSHKIFLQKNDIFYMFSDGYADQFGGPEGKKFKYRRFRHLLLTIHKLPIKKQQEILTSSISEWQGDGDQVDDILVIGIRP